MNTAGKAQYFGFLENNIKSQKKKGNYYSPKLEVSYKADVQRVLQEILRKYPGLINTQNDVEIEPHKLPLVTRENMVEYLKHSRKGSVCFYRDEEGKTRIMLNAGPGYGAKRNRVLFFDEGLKNERPENFKQILHRALLQHDIEETYRKLQKQQNSQTMKGGFNYARKPIDQASSAFERQFKEMVKSGGKAINPMKAAQSLVLAMPGSERSKLNSAFQRMNVKNGAELEGLLSQWKYEALSPERTVTQQRSRGIGPTRA